MIEDNVQQIGKIDRKMFTDADISILTEDVVLTVPQLQHIMQKHPSDYEDYHAHLTDVLRAPDFILEANKPNSAILLKAFVDNGEHFHLVLRLKVENDPAEYKNSIITF
ncbi:MAG: PBECR2 nuclease fold domain-containing protein [Oscillospiraceae bacterium]|nr:PBECR2 nuclease fold domain-containing protein [Oscillospiraceae bacterium]